MCACMHAFSQPPEEEDLFTCVYIRTPTHMYAIYIRIDLYIRVAKKVFMQICIYIYIYMYAHIGIHVRM